MKEYRWCQYNNVLVPPLVLKMNVWIFLKDLTVKA